LVSEVIKNCLKRHAEVVPWYLDSVWKHGDFILQVLLEQAPKYDFAVIIFGQDDKTISRGNEAYAPRDNVIFEAGLFMAHLGHKRTFIVTPREQNLKILSDLAGLVLLSYDEPTLTSGLKGALKSVCDKICTELSFSSEREDIALDAEIAEHYINVFNNWFERNWQTGRRIYPK
jgi:predicted nucleotide-binding protein